MAELYRYAAFISYSSKDSVFARRLHRALERYRIPKSLGAFDPIGEGKPNRIYPVFRDREELSAGPLSELIEASLKASASLIVVCSPASAASPWVQKEIDYFVSIGRRERIFAIIADTAPLKGAAGEDLTLSLFPAAFSSTKDDAAALEPLAGDARKGRDGFRSAWLKLVAGIIGVSPGVLEDRDRRHRRVTAIQRAGVSLLAMLAIAAVGGLIASNRMAERSHTLAELARVASEDGAYDRAGLYAVAALAGSDWPLIGFDASVAEAELRRAMMASPLRLSLRGHTGGVGAVAYSPDGERVATAGGDNTIRVWNAQSGEEMLVIQTQGSAVRLNFTTDGARIVGAGFEGTWVWDATSGATLYFEPLTEAPLLFDAARGRALPNPRGFFGFLDSSRMSPDGGRFASTDGRFVIVHDAQTSRELLRIRAHEWGVDAVEFSASGNRILSSREHSPTAQVWNAADGRELVAVTIEGAISAARLSADGARVAVASENTAYVWDVDARRQIAIFRGDDTFRTEYGRGDWIQTLTFSPNGQFLVTTSQDNKARIWDIAGGREFLSLRWQGERFYNIAFSPNGAHVVTGSSEDDVARVWDVSDARLGFLLSLPDTLIQAADYSPDGQRIVTISDDNVVRVWDSAGATVQTEMRGHSDVVSSARFSADGTRIVTASNDNTARVWDSVTGRELLRVGEGLSGPADEHSPSMGAADLDSTGQVLITGQSGLMDHTAQIWDARTGREIGVLEHPEPVWDLRFSRDGRRIITASRDGSARVWSPAGRLLYTLSGHENGVLAAELNADGALAVTSAYDNTARIWDVAGQRQIARLRHLDRVSQASFSHDGSRIVTASGDAARIWDTRTGRFLGAVRIPEVSDARFSPDGRDLLVSSSLGGAGVFYLNPAVNAERTALRDVLCDVYLPDRDASRFSDRELEDTPILNPDLDGDPCRPAGAWTRLRWAVGLPPSWRAGATVADARMGAWMAASYQDRLASAAVLARRAGQGANSDGEHRRAAERLKVCIESRYYGRDEVLAAELSSDCARDFGWETLGATP
ncbi:MAG: TIR domain-containing protein [Hyphomonadaceae bacterium]